MGDIAGARILLSLRFLRIRPHSAAAWPVYLRNWADQGFLHLGRERFTLVFSDSELPLHVVVPRHRPG